MHILHLIPSHSWRGGENQVSLLAQGLLENGIRTTVATPRDSTFAAKSIHIPHIHLPSLSPLGVWQMLRFIRKEHVTHIDVHSSHAHNWGLFLKIFAPKCQFIVHRRVDNKPRHTWKYRTRLVDHYIPISEAIGEVLLGIGIPKHRMSVVHSATDGEKFHLVDQTIARENLLDFCNLSNKQDIIGTTAALTEQKGIDTLLYAMPDILKKHPNTHLCIAGDGILRTKLEQLCENLRIQKSVTFLGWLDSTEDFLAAIDLFVLPSNNEGLGTSILDAFHSKTCVIATQVGGIPEMIKPGKTGLLVPAKNPPALANAIQKALASRQLRERLIKGATQLVDSVFTKDLMVRKNIEVYHRLFKAEEPVFKVAKEH